MLRVMTYNILFGGVGRERLVGEAVGRIKPDIAIFCEVTTGTSLEAVAASVGRHFAGSGSGRARVAIVSRWPIVKVETFQSVRAPHRSIAATILPPGGPPICVCGAHLVPQPLWPFEVSRFFQVGALLRQLQSRAGPFHLLGGDFNALAPGDPVHRGRAPGYVRAQWWLQAGLIPRWALGRLAAAGYTDCYRTCNPTATGFTAVSWNPHIRIDYVFASRALAERLRASDVLPGNGRGRPTIRRTLAQLLASRTLSNLGGEASDHLPVWADFEWPPNA